MNITLSDVLTVAICAWALRRIIDSSSRPRAWLPAYRNHEVNVDEDDQEDDQEDEGIQQIIMDDRGRVQID